MPTYAYPPFPTSSSTVGFLIGLVEWIFEIPLVAIANFISGIADSVTTAGQQDAQAVVGFVGQTWQDSVSQFSSLGVFAPIVASFVWGVGILILIFFVFKAFQLGVRETEED